MSVDVWLAATRGLEEPDPDRRLLDTALSEAGISARWPAWDDAKVDWAAARLCYPRATWDYHLDLDGFLRWAAAVDRVTTLRNPLSVLRWNTHKGYLLDLTERGVRCVPTRLVEQGSATRLADVRVAEGWGVVVMKPAVSCSSWETFAVEPGDDGEPHWSRLLAERDMLVQPFVASVETVGERCVVVVDDEITHVVRKNPRFAGGVESVSGPFECTAQERRLVEQSLGCVEAALDYARVDIVQDSDGEPMVAELELVEPSLYFEHSERALSRFVAMVERHIQQS